MFSINDIAESDLNKQQLYIKQQFLSNKKLFESTKRLDYLAFKKGLLSDISETQLAQAKIILFVKVISDFSLLKF